MVEAATPSSHLFGMTDDQAVFYEMASRFAKEVLEPGVSQREKDKRLSPDLLRQMGELGLIGVEFPEEYGGLGADNVTSGLILEAISGGDFNVGYVQLLASLCGTILSTHASPEICRKVLPELASGEKLIAIALTEPKGGSDAGSLGLRAEKFGDKYILTGEKASISMVDQASYAVVFARTGSEADRARGITAFLVDLESQGVACGRYDGIGEHAVGHGSLFLDGVIVPKENRLGEEGAGFVQVMQGFDFSRALIGLQCLAVARKSLAETWVYITERQSFGRPLSVNQGVTFPLAEYDTYLEAARLLCLKTLAAKDAGVHHTREAAMCKWWAPKIAFEAIHQCLLMHGHSGYSKDMPFDQRLRDVLGLQIGDGTAQIMKMIIARENLKQF